MATCQYCGDEFGNEGACTTHENSCDEKPEPQRAPNQNQQRQPQQQTGQRADGRQQPPARQQQENAAPPATMNEEAVATGAQMGETLAKMGSNDPTAAEEGRGTFLQMVGSALANAGAKVTERAHERDQAARQAAGQDLQRSDDFPYCPKCDAQIREMPPDSTQFPCPECGTVLEFA